MITRVWEKARLQKLQKITLYCDTVDGEQIHNTKVTMITNPPL